MTPTSLRRLALAALAASLLAGCAAVPAPKQNIVLVHGAWMGASSWDGVAADLRGRGFNVVAVELPGHGNDRTPVEQLSLAGYVDAVVAALPADGRSVLVGHSMAGMVIFGVAEKAPARLSKLVYLAAYLPADGDSMYKLSKGDSASLVPKYWTQADPKANSPAGIRSEGIVETFCADCGAAEQALLLKTHRAEAVRPLGTPLKLSAANFGSVPRAYVHTRLDNAVSWPFQQAMLKNAGGAALVIELDSSHAPMLSQPRKLADAIAQAAR
jgi:pimeloyl-ACP methyl ester carboxylesterase